MFQTGQGLAAAVAFLPVAAMVGAYLHHVVPPTMTPNTAVAVLLLYPNQPTGQTGFLALNTVSGGVGLDETGYLVGFVGG